MATYTAVAFNAQPKGVHAGVNSVSGTFNLGATAASVGDVIFLAKVPHGANFVNLEADHSTGSTAFGVSYGLASGGPAGSATFSCFIASGAQASVLRRTVVGVPAQVSVSDNDPNRYGILSAKVESGTMTTSLIINFVFSYRADGTGG
jgi:hypothetical protein